MAHAALRRLEALDKLDAEDARERARKQEVGLRAVARGERFDVMDALDTAEREIAAGRTLLRRLQEACGQTHLTEKWVEGREEDGKRRLLQQLLALDRTCPGGLVGYVQRAQMLLKSSAAGENPLKGYTPSVPSGFPLTVGTPEFLSYEAEGAAAFSKRAAFVIVAGGLGERLGYSGIKLALPAEMVSSMSYLELYVRHILALQRLPEDSKSCGQIPLVIMTSDDTDRPTRVLLQQNANFGMAPGQILMIKQSKVPCLEDNNARLALNPADKFCLLTKPHGHGDVHSLLHTSGIAKRLLAAGRTHLIFMQDTNALVFGGLPAALGVSLRHGLVLNSVSVPRCAGDQSGALMELKGEDGSKRVVNVEYNQIDGLVKGALDARGDYNDDSGRSPFPGNTNQLVFALREYVATLEASDGVVPEFVNPKYVDASRTSFKSPTRLECMMQDLPWLMPPSARVSFTMLDSALSYCPVKNSLSDAAKKMKANQSPGCASYSDQAQYLFNAKLLEMCGASIEPSTVRTIAGIPLAMGSAVILLPLARPTLGIAMQRMKGSISISARSTLLLDGDISIERLALDGALTVRAIPGASVCIRHLRVQNEGHILEELTEVELDNTHIPEVERLRGYRRRKLGERTFLFDQPGKYIIDESADA